MYLTVYVCMYLHTLYVCLSIVYVCAKLCTICLAVCVCKREREVFVHAFVRVWVSTCMNRCVCVVSPVQHT